MTRRETTPDPTLGYIQDLARLGSAGRSLRRRIEEQSPGLVTVLIADDEPFIRALLAATLSPESYEILEAATGVEALDMVRTFRPRLVILDVRMPAPDGLEVCRQLKVDPDLQTIRVLVLSGATVDDAELAAAGADSYLRKPFSPIQLLETIEHLLIEGPSPH